MPLYHQFVKVLKAIFKGPTSPRIKREKRNVVRSSSHTRYSNTPRVKPVEKEKTSVSTKKKMVTAKPKTKILKPQPKLKIKATKPAPPEFYVGEITHYFSKISVVVVKIVDHPILMGDLIHIQGSADFRQKVESLQVESKDVRFARRGELVGLKVNEAAKPGDKIFKIKK